MANDTATKLLARVKQRREGLGLTQEAFAEKAGLGYKYYQHVEAGRRRDLRLSTIEKLAKACELKLWELMEVDAPLPLRQSIDAGLNYVGVILAILLGVGALGIDFTNLAIVLGALSVGIGLGLQNIANNVISGVILLVERPIKAGDWVSVSGHEGFVRHINIRATEIETFQRTSVIVPNSIFLQNPVINRTYSDTSSRIDIQLTVGLGTDVPKLEGILRETALGNPRVLRVPMPIVRFVRVTTTGLDFELFVFVAQLEDRQVVANDLNRTLLARLIEEKIIDPRPVPELRLRDLDKIAAILKPVPVPPTTDAAAPPTS